MTNASKRLNVSACNFCSSEEYKDLFLHHDNNYYVDHEEFHLVRCEQCGLVRVKDPPRPELISHYYPRSDYYAYSTNKSILSTLKKNFYNIISRLSHKIAAHIAFNDLYFFPTLDTPSSVLDIGCGDGTGLLLLKSFGFKKLFGTEIDKENCLALQKKGINASQVQDITNFKITNHFDAIRLNHVLEHVYNPYETLRFLRTKLKKEGKIYIAVPNYSSVAALTFGRYFCGLQLPTHLHHFDKKVLLSIMKKSGYKVVRTRTVGLSGFSYSIKTWLKDKHGINIPEKVYLPVVFFFLPLEFFLNLIGQGFMINAELVKDTSI